MLYIKKLSSVIILSMGICFGAIVLFSCDDKAEKNTESVYDPELIPTVNTHNDTMYISDSGRIRYRVISATTLLFDKAKEPYSLFPNKAYLEEYDSLMNVVTTLRADSVWNYKKKKLWKLRGRVKIVNVKGESFTSEELFWDQEKDLIYSNVHVIIRIPNEYIKKAYNFKSNSKMTEYTFGRSYDSDYYWYEDEEDTKGIEKEE